MAKNRIPLHNFKPLLDKAGELSRATGRVVTHTLECMIFIAGTDEVPDHERKHEFTGTGETREEAEKAAKWSMLQYIARNPRRKLIGLLGWALVFCMWYYWPFGSTEQPMTDSPIEEVHNG